MCQRGSVCVVILNWNGWRDTAACITSVLSQEQPCRLIVVDNDSDDGSEHYLRTAFPEITVLQSGKNLGYAGGNNIGIRLALGHAADYICLLNNDVTLPSGALKSLVEVLEQHPGLGAVSPIFFSDPEGRRTWCTGTGFHPRSGQSEHRHAIPIPPHGRTYVEVPYVPGACMLVRHQVFEDIGLLPEEYFLYYEDADWSLAAGRANWILAFVPSVRVIHPSESSTSRENTVIPYYYTRNFILFLSRNPDVVSDTSVARRLYFRFCLRRVVLAMCTLRFDAANAVIKGLVDGYRGYFGKKSTRYRFADLSAALHFPRHG